MVSAVQISAKNATTARNWSLRYVSTLRRIVFPNGMILLLHIYMHMIEKCEKSSKKNLISANTASFPKSELFKHSLCMLDPDRGPAAHQRTMVGTLQLVLTAILRGARKEVKLYKT